MSNGKGTGEGPRTPARWAYFNVAARAHMAVMRSFMRRQFDRAMEPLC